MKKWLWISMFMSLAMIFFVMTKCGFRSQTIVIVSTKEATPIERKAANELAIMLERLFKVEVNVESSAEKAASSLIYVGRPQSNRALEKLIGSDWPDLPCRLPPFDDGTGT